MSAAPQTIHRRSAGLARPYRTSTFSRLYRTEEEVSKRHVMMDRSRWGVTSAMPRRVIRHHFRVCNGAAQAGLLTVIRDHTAGAPRGKGGKAPEWTEPMSGDDFAVELGFTGRELRDAIADALRRGLIARKGESGPDSGRYKLLEVAWKSAPNAFVPRKGPGSEGIVEPAEERESPVEKGEEIEKAKGESTAKVEAKIGSYTESRGTVVPRGKPFLLAPQTAAEFEHHTCRNLSRDQQISICATVTPSGRPQLDLLPLPANSRTSPAGRFPAPDAPGRLTDLEKLLKERPIAPLTNTFLLLVDQKLTPSTPLAAFGEVLDEELAACKKKGKKFDYRWLIGIAAKTAELWLKIGARAAPETPSDDWVISQMRKMASGAPEDEDVLKRVERRKKWRT